jgi:membrane-bound ClpP family serine protease
VIEYIKAHWRGDLSLTRSYWVNGFLLGLALQTGTTLLQAPLSRQPVNDAAALATLVALIGAVAVWQLVGIWRSASNASLKTGRSFWPSVAKLLICLTFLRAAADVGTATIDLTRTLQSLRDPLLNEYAIERRGDTDLIFTGAINEISTTEVIRALEDPAIKILRVNSRGGLIDPAIRLARHIRENKVMVMAEVECISACVMLLAASPYAAISPGTKVTFHRAEPLAEFTNPEIRRENSIYLAQAQDVYP